MGAARTTVAAIIMGAAHTTEAVEGITAEGSIQEVSWLGARPESTVPSRVLEANRSTRSLSSRWRWQGAVWTIHPPGELAVFPHSSIGRLAGMRR